MRNSYHPGTAIEVEVITAFSALENVMMPMLGAAGFADEAMRQRAASLLASVRLTPWQNNLAGNLSGGQPGPR